MSTIKPIITLCVSINGNYYALIGHTDQFTFKNNITKDVLSLKLINLVNPISNLELYNYCVENPNDFAVFVNQGQRLTFVAIEDMNLSLNDLVKEINNLIVATQDNQYYKVNVTYKYRNNIYPSFSLTTTMFSPLPGQPQQSGILLEYSTRNGNQSYLMQLLSYDLLPITDTSPQTINTIQESKKVDNTDNQQIQFDALILEKMIPIIVNKTVEYIENKYRILQAIKDLDDNDIDQVIKLIENYKLTKASNKEVSERINNLV